MSRTISFAYLAVVMISICAVAQSTVPTLTVSIYAPKEKDAPLRITGFQIRNGAVGVSIYNQSDKTVTSFALAGLLSTPPGCASDSTFAGKAYVSSRKMNLTIRSHETATVWDTGEWSSPFDPTGLVPAAQRYKYAYLHVQAVVFAVHPSDGRIRGPAPESMSQSRVAILDPQLAILDFAGVRSLRYRQHPEQFGECLKNRFQRYPCG